MTRIYSAEPSSAAQSESISELKPRLRQDEVYSYLVHECLSLYAHTVRDIERHWDLSEEEARHLGVCSCPSEIGNLIASQKCARKFADLTGIPGFYSYDRLDSMCCCFEWWNECVCILTSWRLNVDPRLSQSGLIVPIGNSLMVYRSAKDPHPFKLAVRTRRVA
jgi:hypothetical protein